MKLSERDKIRRAVKGKGYHASPLEVNKKGYYRKQDGKIHPVLLPLDVHHLTVYGKKGWAPVQEDVAEVEIIEQIAETAKIRKAHTTLVDGHTHNYNKKLGSSCKTEGCPQVRTKPYMKRSTEK